MRILVATDAWHPQVNGVVRTLTSLARAVERLGGQIEFLTPEGFPSVPLPGYRGLRLAIPSYDAIARRIEAARPDAIHVMTEGSIGYFARRYCIRHGKPFTTSFATRFPEYIAARWPVPERLSYALLRRFHSRAAMTLVSTTRLLADLSGRGFNNLRLWGRGVDTDLFDPRRAKLLDLPRPIFVTAGRVAVEKNLEAFLALDLPGSKVVIGNGPQVEELRQRFPDTAFLGEKVGADLPACLAAADVFVFPSRTDTFGVVQLEALACGLPVAAYPVPGPLDVIGGTSVGVLNEDLKAACLAALDISRRACRAFALDHSWEVSAQQFLEHMHSLAGRPYAAQARKRRRLRTRDRRLKRIGLSAG